MGITDFPMITTIAGSCPVSHVTLPAASWPFGGFLSQPAGMVGGFEWHGMLFGFSASNGIVQLLPVPNRTTVVAQARRLPGVPEPPYDTVGMRGDQVFIQQGGKVYLVALEVFPIVTRYHLYWDRPGQLFHQDPTKEHTSILEHGNGIHVGSIGFGETTDDVSGFRLDQWFRVLDMRAGVTQIPLLDRPAARGMGPVGQSVTLSARAAGGFYDGLWETTVAGENVAEPGQWTSDGKRIYEVIHAESAAGGGTKMVLWPNMRMRRGLRLFPAFTVRARYVPETPTGVPRVGEVFQRSTYNWQEVVE